MNLSIRFAFKQSRRFRGIRCQNVFVSKVRVLQYIIDQIPVCAIQRNIAAAGVFISTIHRDFCTFHTQLQCAASFAENHFRDRSGNGLCQPARNRVLDLGIDCGLASAEFIIPRKRLNRGRLHN